MIGPLILPSHLRTEPVKTRPRIVVVSPHICIYMYIASIMANMITDHTCCPQGIGVHTAVSRLSQGCLQVSLGCLKVVSKLPKVVSKLSPSFLRLSQSCQFDFSQLSQSCHNVFSRLFQRCPEIIAILHKKDKNAKKCVLNQNSAWLLLIDFLSRKTKTAGWPGTRCANM